MASEVDTYWNLGMNNMIKSGWMSQLIYSRNLFAESWRNSFDKSSDFFNHSSNLTEFNGYIPTSAIDDIVSKSVFGILNFIGVDMKKISPITKDLPLIQSPTPVVLSVIAYLLVVCIWSAFIRVSGQKPRKQDPAALKYLIIFHNLFLCGLSFFMGFGILWEVYSSGWSFLGNYIRDTDYKVGYIVYIFYVSKIYEFMDTVIMLLKRNLRQVSYLHVYHHASISIIWWIMSYRCPGGDAYFSVAFNSWVHVIMYLYYLLAATIAKEEKLRKKYLFWGKYLTILQMFQFVSFILQSVYGMLHPEFYPKGVPNLLFFYSLSLLLFFGDFFVKKHCVSQKGRSKKMD